jgi:FAD/FMN-containing dehydrogenase
MSSSSPSSDVIVHPDSVEEIAHIMHIANRHRIPVIP